MHTPPRLPFAAAMAAMPGFVSGLEPIRMYQRPRSKQTYVLGDTTRDPDTEDSSLKPSDDHSHQE